MRTKIYLQFILLLVTSLISMSKAAETVLISFENPLSTEMVSETKWSVSPLPSWVISHGIVDNPVKDVLKNNTNKCYKVQQGANAPYEKNFVYFQLKEPITITEENRYLHIKHYRQVLNDEWMVTLNTSKSPYIFFWEQDKRGTYRFEGQNALPGQWEDIVVDLSYLIYNNEKLTDFNFGFSMDWNGSFTNPASDYYVDEIVLSNSSTPRILTPTNYTSIQPGLRWNDDRGNYFNAHGGGILYVDNTYYYIGETRIGIAPYGVNCYSSKDMYNWKFESRCLTMPFDPLRSDMQDMNHGRLLERPKVLYNEKTKKFVMWVHWEDGSGGYGEARVLIATADKVTGPYQFVKTFRPNGQESRDQTLFMDDDGKAYQFRSSEVNATLQISELADDFLNVKNTSSSGYSRNFVGWHFEGPAIFKHKNKYFGFFSGTTGWSPNPAKSAGSNSVLTGWYYINNPCVDDNANVTFYSQPANVFKIPGKTDAYMYIGDRWTINSSIAASTQVWLPISMRTGVPAIHWYDSWDLTLFDKINGYKQVTAVENEKTYYMLAKHSDRFVSLDGTKLTQWKDDDTKNLALTFISAGSGWYKIKNSAGKFLDTSSSLSFANQTQADAQLWRLDSGVDGFFFIYNKANNQVIDVADYSLLNGANFGTWTKKALDDYPENQLFGIFEKTNTTAVNQIKDVSKGIEIFPNPSNGNVNMLLRGYSNTNTTIVVADLNGKTCYQRLFQSESMVNLNLSKLNEGVYIVKAISDSGISTQKLVIKK